MEVVKYKFHFEDEWQEVEGQADQKLVEMTMAAEVRTPHACLEGGCGSCKCKLVEGQVDTQDPNGLLDDEEIESGLILACQSRALTPTIAVDFDLD
ncbi:MAG: 2Fe-2S iron-sulfur cluster-binding protein [Bdellovibrionales bacterium]